MNRSDMAINYFVHIITHGEKADPFQLKIVAFVIKYVSLYLKQVLPPSEIILCRCNVRIPFLCQSFI
jgi:hypothetical protein